MSIKSNRYNPIAYAEPKSSRYDPISAVSEVEKPKNYQQSSYAPTVDSSKINTPELSFWDKTKSVLKKASDYGLIGFGGVPSLGKGVEKSIQPAVDKVSEIPAVKQTVKTISERTSGTGIYSTIQSISPDKTFRQAYEANKEYQAGNPAKLNQFMYQLGDTLPQTAIGVALSFVPYGGRALATTYWTALSASEQIESKGKVTNVGNVAIDVALDGMLGKSIEALFKAPAKTLVSTITQNFTTEGGTEVAQDLLKYANSYRMAETQDERDVIMNEAKEYFTSGQILMTAGVGGISGAMIGGGAYGLNKRINQGQVNPILNEAPMGSGRPSDGLSRTDITTSKDTLDSSLKSEPASRFATAQELLREVGRPKEGPQGFDINRNEARQLIEYLSSLDKSKALERGIVAKPYGAKPWEVDIILGNTGFESGRLEGGKVVIEAIRNEDGTYELKNRLRVHGTPLRDGDIIERLNTSQLKRLSSPTITSEESKISSTKEKGYKKLVERLDKMVENKTMLPEDVTILKTLFEDTNDRFLNMLNIGESSRLKVPGRFSVTTEGQMQTPIAPTNKLLFKKGLASEINYATSQPSKVFAHEYGHAGWYLILTNSERQMVTDIFSKMKRPERVRLFEGGLSGTTGSAKYYAKNPQEFFAESFAGYVFENKVPAPQMKSLLQKVAGKFFDAMKRLVSRGNVPAVQRMAPLFEKILKGDKSTPLSKFESPPSFKKDLQEMFNTFEKPVGPNSRGIFVDKNRPPVQLPPPNVSKQVPVESMLPIEETQQGAITPPTENSPIDIIPEPAQKVIETDVRTPINERVGMIDYLRTPWRVFEKMGIRPIYNELFEGYQAYVQELPQNINKITEWSKQVPAESNEKIFRALDGEKVNLTIEEAIVAGEIKTWLSQWADRMDMQPDARISEYITHIFPFGKGGEIPQEIAFLINKKIPGSVYNPFLLQRQGAEGYIKDTWKALDAYVKRATRKVNMDPALESLKEASSKMSDTSQLDYLNRYVGAINLRPTELDTLIDNTVKGAFGYTFGARPTAAITKTIRKMISSAKIGGSITSLAKNLTQGVNTYADLGIRYTTKGYMDLVKFGSKELNENGVLIAPFIEDRTYSHTKQWAKKFDNVLFLNMTASELVNRGAAYYGAKAKFLDRKITPKEFKKAFGKNMPAGYSPTLQDAITYGKYVSAKTQFLFGPIDTPVGLTSDIAKTAFQFQTFGLKQTEFLGNMIGDREYMKLMRYLISSSLLFAFIGGAFGMKWDESFKTFRFGPPPAYTAFKELLAAALGWEDKYGNVPSPSARARNAGKTLFTNIVPGGAQIKRGFEGFQAVNQGYSKSSPTKANPKGSFQYEIDKTPINYVRGTLFGKQNLPAAKEYYKKKDEKKSGGSSSSNRYNPI
jgi:hypothetical protein